ncbi:MAG: plasmid pRiA4b ORF-3 family protein [Candidatus Dormibacteria bacterium]
MDFAEELRRRGQPGLREYQVHVQLRDIQPAIWRRLVLPDDLPLPRLHAALQYAFGWAGRHLHEFAVGPVCFGKPDPDAETRPIDEKGVLLNQLAREVGDRIVYTYDFGDGWTHDLVLEDVWAAEGKRVPRCLDGERAGPLDDCGGPGGYADMLRVLADPADPEHLSRKVWAGVWKPEHFDLRALNVRLAHVASSQGRPPRRRG